jgi:hypothetical protein
MGIATNAVRDLLEGKPATESDIQAAILCALVGIGEMLHDIRPDVEVPD